MSFFKRWYDGYVRVKLKGQSQERFLNICSGRGIILTNMKYSDDGYICTMCLKDYLYIKPVVKKCGVVPYIKSRHGLPAILGRIKKRISLFIGIIISIVLIFVLSAHIWNIEIEGNLYHTDEQLLKLLENNNIRAGTRISDIDCPGLEAEIRLQYPDIGWVSAEINGTGLKLMIKETKDPTENLVEENRFGDIVAKKNGIVKKIVTREGTALVKEGDRVKEGDILISGKVVLYNDNAEPYDNIYKLADGDILLESRYEYKASMSRDRQIKYYSGRNKKGYIISFFGNKIFSYQTSIPYTTCDIITKRKMFEPLEDFYIPVEYTEITYNEYEIVHMVLSDEEMKESLLKQYNEYINSMKEFTICGEMHDIVCNDKYAMLEGVITVEAPLWEYAYYSESQSEVGFISEETNEYN